MPEDQAHPEHSQDPTTPLVTIGLPVRNGGDYLAEAIESVLNQDYPDLELVIRDNASSDSTEGISRRYAAADSRVRYIRSETNIGLLPNFRRVRDAARGTYFAWLSHDDRLASESYVSRVVRFMELHPDVVACNTSICVVKDSAEPPSVVDFPQLHPDCAWQTAMRAMFRWPNEWLEMGSLALFRRDNLARLPIRERTHTGRPAIFCWEIDLLTALALQGRIVALPEPLRAYRSSPSSTARVMGRSVSPFDLLVLDLEMKLVLLARTLRAPGSKLDRLGLVATALANLFTSVSRRRFDHRYAVKQTKKELALLSRAADERLRLIRTLESELDIRRKLLFEQGFDLSRVDSGVSSFAGGSRQPSADIERLATRPSLGFFADFFNPPSEAQIGYHRELTERVVELRSFCEELLRQIEQLHDDASDLELLLKSKHND